MKPGLPQFEEATGIDVVYDYVPFPNMKEALTTEMVAGGDYDVVSVMDQWVVSLQMLLQPIGAEMEAQGTDLSDFPAAHMRHGMLDGELIGLPVRGHVQLLFYRKDLLEAAGVAPPQTWEDMVTVAKAIQDTSDAAGIALPYGKLNGQNMMVWMNLLWGNGGDLFDAQGNPVIQLGRRCYCNGDLCQLLGRRNRAGRIGYVRRTGRSDQLQARQLGHVARLVVGALAADRPGTIDPDRRSGGLYRHAVCRRRRPHDIHQHVDFRGDTGIRRKGAATEFLGWLTDPALERDVLLDPELDEVVAVHMSNLTDAEVNERWGGMHQAAADALATAEGVEFGDNWPRDFVDP